MKLKYITEIEALSQTIATFTKIAGYSNRDYEYFEFLQDLKCYANPVLLMYKANCALCQYYHVIKGTTCDKCPLKSCGSGPYNKAKVNFSKGDFNGMRNACLEIVSKCQHRMQEMEVKQNENIPWQNTRKRSLRFRPNN